LPFYTKNGRMQMNGSGPAHFFDFASAVFVIACREEEEAPPGQSLSLPDPNPLTMNFSSFPAS
jgi:hypothetical protein